MEKRRAQQDQVEAQKRERYHQLQEYKEQLSKRDNIYIVITQTIFLFIIYSLQM